MTHDYSELDPLAPTWTGIDSKRILSDADLELVTRARDAAAAFSRLVVGLPAVLHVIRDAEAGHPRAAVTDHSCGGQVPWCWEHERTTKQCEATGFVCVGEVIDGPSDPTGTAAMGADPVGRQAAHDLRVVRRDLARASAAVANVDAILRGYPAQATVDLDVKATPGPDHCRLCFECDCSLEPVARNSKGHRRYKDLCRSCGDWRKSLGGDPPLWLVAMVHRGDMITPVIRRRAQQDVTRRSKKRTKPKGKKSANGWEATPTTGSDTEASDADRAARVDQMRAARRERLR